MASAYHLKRKLQKELLMSQRASELVQAGLPGGKVFWVKSDGSNSNDGSPDYPFLTIKYALTKCANGNEDTILIHSDYWQPTGEDWPIVVNKTNVHITGVNHGFTGYCPTIKVSGDYAAFSMGTSGAGSELSNLVIAGGTTNGCVSLGGTGHFWIHDCMFGNADNGSGQDGIRSEQGTVNTECLIEDNIFHGNDQGVPGLLTRNGIDARGTNLLRHAVIRRNIFMGCAIGILLGNSAGVSILNNNFLVDGAATGEAITLGAGSRGCFINGNAAADKKSTGVTQNPYVDGYTVNGWAANYASGTLTFPS